MSATMQAAVLHATGHLQVDMVPTPEPGQGEVVLHVGANTLCGTDLRILRGEKTRGVRFPSVLGHEFAGTVAAVGADVQGFAEGDKAAMCPVIPCRRCVHCLHDRENVCANRRAMGYEYDGGLAEYVRIPAEAMAAGNLFPADADIPLEQLALAEPLACTVNGHRRSGIRLGDVVLVIGAGPIGLLHLQLARRAGASAVIVSEPSPSRRAVAAKLGASHVVAPMELAATVEALTDRTGVDASIVCIGIPQLVNDAIALTRKAGNVNIFAGLPADGRVDIPANEIHYKELVVTGTSAMHRRDYEQALRLIGNGEVDVASLVTDKMPLASVVEAFELAQSGTGIKVAVVP
ncbi:zinc-binding dehydrogenase [Amycolatopsis marina]|uniref:zinc-binding dehydrogenase n=1 Tax=Amycolatopsis marina TaxID=490629 RepID=UPI001C435CBD|nr:alcohol dehydrogenase catalytic domain-containing protein [Amycolatopsis marina]